MLKTLFKIVKLNTEVTEVSQLSEGGQGAPTLELTVNASNWMILVPMLTQLRHFAVVAFLFDKNKTFIEKTRREHEGRGKDAVIR